MSILAVDYGRKNLGLAITFDQKVTHLLAPIYYHKKEEAFLQLKVLLDKYPVQEIVVGLPLNLRGEKGKMAKEAYRFGKKAGEALGKKVSFQNETLTSRQARNLAIAAQVPRRKRSQKEHSLAAQLILQDFLSQMQKPKMLK